MLLDDKSQMVNQQDMIIYRRSVFGHRWLWNSSRISVRILDGIPLKKAHVICKAIRNS